MPQQEGGGGGDILPTVDEPGNKGGRGGPPGPGGGPGGGGGGSGFSAFGGGGVRPNVFRGLQGFGQDIPLIMRKRGIPGLTPGPPGRSDTVPALLSPGEMVMNNGVTSQPDVAQMLAALNMNGAQQMGYETGGMVPQGGDGAQAGFPGSRLMRLLQMLMALEDGGQTQGFALGGFVQPGGFGGFGGRQPGGAGFLGRNQPSGGASTAAPPQEPGGYQYNPEGGVTGGFNPADPYGPYTANRDPRVYGGAVRGLGGFGNAGYFDPRGNQALINSAEQGAQGTADALVRRGTTAADLSGLDPAQRAVAKLQALQSTGRGVQDIMAQTRAGALGSQNDFAQRLYAQLLGGDLGFTGQQQAASLQDYLANAANERNRKGQWGALAGQLGGAAIGGLVGGPGGAMAGYGAGRRVPQTPIANFGPYGGLDNLPQAP